MNKLPLRLFALIVLLLPAPVAWGTTYSLGTTSLLEGHTAGTDSVVLEVTPETQTWTATTNATWLHLSAPNRSGTGSTNLVFSFDANVRALTRAGIVTIGGQTLTVTQAGSAYVAAGSNVTMLVSNNTIQPYGVAVDGAGNVYFADTGNSAIQKWTVTNNTMTTLVSNLRLPTDVAVDAASNVFFAEATKTTHGREMDGGQQQRDHGGVQQLNLALRRGGGRRG